MTTAAGTSSPTHGIGGILSHAFELYRAHARVFLVAAGIALVPLYLIHALAFSALIPASVSTTRLEEQSQRIEQRSRELQEKQRNGTLTSADAARLQQEMVADATAGVANAGAALAGVGLFFLAMMLLIPLSMLGTFLGTAAVIPLVDDREKGGTMTPGEAWSRVGARLGPLLLTAALATIAVFAGLFFFFLPGLILAFFFAFAAPVVMFENKSGVAALRSSSSRVMSNLFPTAVVLLVMVVLTAVARVIGALLTPSSWVFLHTLISDAISLIVFPLPIIGLVLLYRETAVTEPPPQLGEPIPAH